MKFNKIFRILALAIILSLLMTVIPATPALAYDYDIEVDPEQGKIGDEITITGDDWSPSYEDDDGDLVERWVVIYFAADEADVGDYIDDEVDTYKKVGTEQVSEEDDKNDSGDFLDTFDVPDELKGGDDDEDVEPGTYYIYVTKEGIDYIRAVIEFTVVGEGDIEIDPDDGPVGSEVEILGIDFGAREDVVIEYDGEEIGDDRTDSDGEFEAIIIIPLSYAGDHEIKVTGEESLAEVTATFTVEPEITISPTEGSARSAATVSGTGFGKRSYLSIFFGTEEIVTDERADSDGSFEAAFKVPDMTPGTYVVEAEDEDNNSAKVQFSVIISISASINPTSGNIGTKVTVTGSGYLGGTSISIKYDTTEVATTIAGIDGSFTTTFKVPLSQSGAHDVTVSDGAATEQFTFTMESAAPPTPQPSLPEMGVKAEQPVYIDWADVTDASPPVTYSLQIATSQNFAVSSIVLEKKGLTESEYTLTEREELSSASKDEPYYWRIRAIDGAGNESAWTGAGSFHLGSTFAFGMPTWLTYLLIAIGVLLLGIFAFWVGRRTAYYSY